MSTCRRPEPPPPPDAETLALAVVRGADRRNGALAWEHHRSGDEMEGPGMKCSGCGQDVPGDANFCPACGAPVASGEAANADTTAAIEVGALDPHHEVEEVPELAPGTGMLVVVRGPNAGSRFLLDRDSTTVGRHPDSNIFLDDVTVSRRHAELLRDEHGTTLKDLGSLNGTYVGGDRVDERRLATGDEVQVGRFKLLYLDAHGARVVSDT